MSGQPIQSLSPADLTTAAPLLLRFETEADLRHEFARNLACGAAFVATDAVYAPAQTVELTLDLAFCGCEVSFPGEVVASVDSALADIAEGATGVSLRLASTPSEIAARIGAATGLELSAAAEIDLAEGRRGRTRRPSGADIVLRTADAEFPGTTANLSYTGALAMISTATIPVGSKVQVELSNPMVELGLTVDGRIIHNRRCDGGVIAHGVQLQYPAGRIDEVMAFIEFLQSFDRARRLATVAGEIQADGLAPILDLFVNTSPAGTLVVTRGDDQGRIVFSENYLLRCTAGMATGTKALSRLFLWTSGRFEFQHDLGLTGTPDEPQPFEAAVMMASVQSDELRRIGLDTFGAGDTFARATAPIPLDRDAFTQLEGEVLDHACHGFSVEVICDMVAEPDADIFKALVVLLDLGAICRAEA
jgi:hypothetical protein